MVEKGTATSLAEGLKIEARHFGELSVSDVSRALVSVFFATQEIKKDAGYPEGTKAARGRTSSACSARGSWGRASRRPRPRRACPCG